MTETELNKLYMKIFEKLDEIEFDISDIVIPFDRIIPRVSLKDIYNGSEDIPFKKRAREYKIILKKEFL